MKRLVFVELTAAIMLNWIETIRHDLVMMAARIQHRHFDQDIEIPASNVSARYL